MTEDEALRRIRDLTRCSAPLAPTIDRDGDHWRGPLDRSARGAAVLVIDAAFGEMRVELPSAAPRRTP